MMLNELASLLQISRKLGCSLQRNSFLSKALFSIKRKAESSCQICHMSHVGPEIAESH